MKPQDMNKIAQIANAQVPETKPAKTKRLLSLTEGSYKAMQAICARKNLSVSEVVDSLIAAYVFVDRQEQQQQEEPAPRSTTKQAP